MAKSTTPPRTTTALDGFIIAQRDWTPDVRLAMGAHTFGATAAEAWRRHIGQPKNYGPDFSTIVQRWSEKGYGPHVVRMELVS